jgi:hypothetical protein
MKLKKSIKKLKNKQLKLIRVDLSSKLQLRSSAWDNSMKIKLKQIIKFNFQLIWKMKLKKILTKKD